jgi:hypothetical protein
VAAYWSHKVALALHGSLPRLRDFTMQREAVVDSYRQALQESRGLSAAQVRERVSEIARPGALPSDEHDRSSDWLLRFGARFGNHREARQWAFERIRGTTTVAVDGSELRPSRDYSIPVGFVQVAWFRNPHLDADGQRYEKDAHLEVVLPGAGASDVSLRRFEMECETLVNLITELKGLDPPPVIYFDGTLVVSFVNEMAHELGQHYIDAVVKVIDASEHFRVPLVGYVDSSDAKDLCVLLSNLEGLPTPRGVNDAAVLGSEMSWGDRTKAFVCARDDRTLDRYAAPGREHTFAREVCFTYLKTTAAGPPARLDVPAWVVRAGLLDHVVDVTRCEVVATAAGYPYAIESADAAAVLRTDDRQRLLRAAQRFCDHHGMDLSVVPKAASKRRRRV